MRKAGGGAGGGRSVGARSVDGQRSVKLHPKRPTIVLFHKPGCPACVNFMPTWDKAKSELSKLAVVQQFARNDEPVDNFMRFNNVSSYPTIMLFNQGETQKFSGERTVDNLVAFVGGGNSAVVPSDNKTKIVFLHWRICGHCHTVRPVWDQMVEKLKHDSQLQFMAHEAEAEPHVMQKYGVSSYPTFLRVQGDNIEQYKGDRTLESLMAFAKPKVRSLEPKQNKALIPDVDLKGFKKFGNGNMFWAVNADLEKNTICVVDGVLGKTPTMKCRKYRGKKPLNEVVRKMIAKVGWDEL
jgi:thiol-disulfide isomerase/thioredoxin